MPDIVLYPGESNQNDIRLRDTTGQSVALAGQQINAYSGIAKPDWRIESQQGQANVLVEVALVGLQLDAATGTIAASGEEPDVTLELTGAEMVSAAGVLVPVFLVEQSGQGLLGAQGTVGPEGGDEGEPGPPVEDEWIGRRRRNSSFARPITRKMARALRDKLDLRER